MATIEDLDKSILTLQVKIDLLKQVLAPNSDSTKRVADVETQLAGLKNRFDSIKQNQNMQNQENLRLVETELRNLDEFLTLIGREPLAERSGFAGVVASLGQNAPGLGVLAIGIAFFVV